jgi:hypothetical protein
VFRRSGSVVPLACALTLLLALPAGASPRTQSAPVTVVASGLANPRGFTWGPDGALYVGLAGTGGAHAGEVAATPTGFSGGATASIVKITDGCLSVVADGLPSSELTAFGWVWGVMDLAFMGDQLYVLEGGGGPVHGNPDHPGGVYRLGSDGALALVADLGTWVDTNAPAVLPPEGFPNEGSLFSMVAGADALWVTDAVDGQILRVTPAGDISRFADLSEGHLVPTGLAPAPDGGLYVGYETAVPFADGTSKVSHIAADGTVTDAWTGLTTVTGVAVGWDGALYAAEMSTGNLDQAPYLQPNSGKIVKQTGPTSQAEVATGLDAPVAIHFGADGALYESGPAFGANAAAGMILRLEIGSGTPVAPTGQSAGVPAVCAGGTPAA